MGNPTQDYYTPNELGIPTEVIEKAARAGIKTPAELAALLTLTSSQHMQRAIPERADNPYITLLPMDQEFKFRNWVKSNAIPTNPDDMNPTYDMRGFWQAMQRGDKRATHAIDKSGKIDFPDTWKTPSHETFSNQSIYATPDAPSWQGTALVDKKGNIIASKNRQRNFEENFIPVQKNPFTGEVEPVSNFTSPAQPQYNSSPQTGEWDYLVNQNAANAAQKLINGR